MRTSFALTRLDAAVLAIAALLLFTGLGAPSLHNEDEARYALAARSVIEDGHWLAPRTDGEPWFNKAPLRVWMTASLAQLRGLDEWSVRLPSALLALGTVAFTLLLGTQLYDRPTGRIAALALSTQLGFLYVHCGRSGEMDAGVLLGWVVIAWSLARAREHGRWLLVAGAALGAIAMLKHVAVAAPPAAFLVLGWWITRHQSRAQLHHLLAAFAIALAVVLPWHLAMVLRHGAQFLDPYLGNEVGGRLAGEMAQRHSLARPWMQLKDLMAPWSLLLPFALLSWPAWSGHLRHTGWLLLVWVCLVMAAMSVARLGLGWYVLPATPALSLVVARALWSGRWRLPLHIAAAFTLAVSPLASWTITPFTERAMKLDVTTDLAGALQGAPVPWLQLAIAIAWIAGVWTLRDRPMLARTFYVGLWIVLAIGAAAWPLRGVMSARSDLDRLVDEVIASERMASAWSASDCWQAHLETDEITTFIPRWSLSRLPVPVTRIDASVPIDSTCWRLQRTGSPVRVDTAWIVGEWSLLPPERPASDTD